MNSEIAIMKEQMAEMMTKMADMMAKIAEMTERIESEEPEPEVEEDFEYIALKVCEDAIMSCEMMRLDSEEIENEFNYLSKEIEEQLEIKKMAHLYDEYMEPLKIYRNPRNYYQWETKTLCYESLFRLNCNMARWLLVRPNNLKGSKIDIAMEHIGYGNFKVYCSFIEGYGSNENVVKNEWVQFDISDYLSGIYYRPGNGVPFFKDASGLKNKGKSRQKFNEYIIQKYLYNADYFRGIIEEPKETERSKFMRKIQKKYGEINKYINREYREGRFNEGAFYVGIKQYNQEDLDTFDDVKLKEVYEKLECEYEECEDKAFDAEDIYLKMKYGLN